MKKILLLSAFLCLSVPTFAQTKEEPTEITDPKVGDIVDVIDMNDTQTYRKVRVRITQKYPIRPGEWEGYGFDAEGNYWFVEHYAVKTIGRIVIPHK